MQNGLTFKVFIYGFVFSVPVWQIVLLCLKGAMESKKVELSLPAVWLEMIYKTLFSASYVQTLKSACLYDQHLHVFHVFSTINRENVQIIIKTTAKISLNRL